MVSAPAAQWNQIQNSQKTFHNGYVPSLAKILSEI